ncbi:MAG: sulfatase [Candidatus Brocadiia bacterium]
MTADSNKPNILFILSDDHGNGDVSFRDGPNIQTPNIDSIAERGMQFSHFYANCSVCAPSRASLLTGRFPDLVGVPGVIRTHATDSWGYFDPNATTLPEMLNRAGYHSSIIGKWHLGLEPENNPCRRGFDFFRGFLGDMMDDYYTHRRFGNNYMRENEKEIDPEGHATDLFTEWAIEVLEKEAETDDPFFLYLAYNAPHTPIQPPDDWIERIREREPDISEQRVHYLALVEHMDHGIGRVLKALEETGQMGDTLVFYSSDNGGKESVGACCGNLHGNKGDVYEGGIRVPTCAMWQDHIEPGSKSTATAMLMDILPTLCDLVEVEVDHEIDGQSILLTLLGQDQNLSERLMYWVRREGGQDFAGLAQHAIRKGNLKLLHNRPFQPLELYDLDGDPLEENDLSDESPDVYNELLSTLREQIRRAGHVPWRKSI